MLRIASYKTNRPGFQGLFNRAVRWGLRIPYSHNELVFSDGVCGSCSFLDKGPRLKLIDLDPAHWDIRELAPVYQAREVQARRWFEVEASRPRPQRIRYSLRLLWTYPFPWLPISVPDNEEVCCTAIMLALGIEHHRKYDPHETPLFLAPADHFEE
jgi:hypothetical protein